MKYWAFPPKYLYFVNILKYIFLKYSNFHSEFVGLPTVFLLVAHLEVANPIWEQDLA